MDTYTIHVPELHMQPYEVKGDFESADEAMAAFMENSADADISYDKDRMYFQRSFEPDEKNYEVVTPDNDIVFFDE